MTTCGDNKSSRTPTGVKVAPTSYEKLEVLANDLRPALPVVIGNRYKLDACQLFEFSLQRSGYTPRIETKSVMGEVAGYTIPEWKIIALREDVYDGLFEDSAFSRSTVIHELSHIALDHATTLNRGAIYGAHRFYEDSEWQANALMAALMMPLEACRAARTPLDLAQMCGTSLEAATYRLNRLVEKGVIPPQRGLWDHGIK